MIKIESQTLEEAYKNAASTLGCSASELMVEVVQYPNPGFMGLFKKNAIIVATKKSEPSKFEPVVEREIKNEVSHQNAKSILKDSEKLNDKENQKKEIKEIKDNQPYMLNDTIMPQSFVSTQDDENYDMSDINFMADYEEEEQKEPVKTKYFDEKPKQSSSAIDETAIDVELNINKLFDLTCFKIDRVKVSAYDEKTLLIEIRGEDAALLIGKEGYRYKALSYIIYNWINTKYQLQLRLEIAEFLKNQEDSIYKYLEGVCENIDRDGRAQTKILDGVLVQIALKELRDRYPDKYVAIRSTRDGLKFIIINDYHN